MERVSISKGMPDINGRQDYVHFPELTTDDWDIYNQDHNKFSLVHPSPLDRSKEVNSVNLLDYEEENMQLGDSNWRPCKSFTK